MAKFNLTLSGPGFFHVVCQGGGGTFKFVPLDINNQNQSLHDVRYTVLLKNLSVEKIEKIP